METINRTHSHVAKAGVHKPSGAANSVFDQVPPKPKKIYAKHAALEIDQVEIKLDVPLPTNRRSPAASVYRALLDKMPAGSMVELDITHAKSLASCAKKNNVKISLRGLDNGRMGAWKLTESAAR